MSEQSESKLNGSKPVQRLAAALHDCVDPPGREERTARLADALQECLDSAVETGTRAARQEDHREAREKDRREVREAARQEARDEVRQEVHEDMAGVKETLRLIWKQCGGDRNKRLPIDN